VQLRAGDALRGGACGIAFLKTSTEAVEEL